MENFTPPDGHQIAAPSKANFNRIERMRKRRKVRRIRILVVCVLILAGILAYFTGIYGTSLALMGDVLDSISIAVTPGDGFPAVFDVSGFRSAEPLAGGFAAVGSKDLALYAANGKLIRTLQHGYARPSITTGNTRVCIYNRGGKELRVESRTRNLYTLTAENPLLLAEMSANGTLAVATQSRLSVYDPLFNEIWYWQTDQIPMSLAFCSDNKQFTAACLTPENGAMGTTLYFFTTQADAPIATVKAEDGIPVTMKYLTRKELLVVYDTFAAVYDTTTGTELAHYDYAGRTLQSASTGAGKNTVLLFGTPTHTALTGFVVLNDKLAEIGTASMHTRTFSVSAGRTAVYLLTQNSVLTYGLDGVFYGETPLQETPLAMLTARDTILISQTAADKFNTPPKPAAERK